MNTTRKFLSEFEYTTLVALCEHGLDKPSTMATLVQVPQLPVHFASKRSSQTQPMSGFKLFTAAAVSMLYSSSLIIDHSVKTGAVARMNMNYCNSSTRSKRIILALPHRELSAGISLKWTDESRRANRVSTKKSPVA